MNIIQKLILTALITTLMTGCHTVQGAGEDLSAGGKALSNAAVKVHSKI